MIGNQLSQIIINGFKSIKECDLELKALNILIGSNGAGKSNFLGFFELIQQILKNELEWYVNDQGGPDALLHFGRMETTHLSAKLIFHNRDSYGFKLKPTQDNRMFFTEDSYTVSFHDQEKVLLTSSSGPSPGHPEILRGVPGRDAILQKMESWRVYHFDDTSKNALVKRSHGITDNNYLRFDASNLAAFLFFLKEYHTTYYNRIVKTIQLVAPFFGDFRLRPQLDNSDQIELEWVEKHSDVPFKAYRLSDGTLRFICLVTLLMQPEACKPSIILIDEPELGLHPYAVKVLAALIEVASKTNQVIVSTQSIELLNEFDAEDIIVADRANDQTQLKRLDSNALKVWLEDYSLGDLWQKNILGGRPFS